MNKTLTTIAVTMCTVTASALGLAGCGDDDGETVRDCPSGSEAAGSGSEVGCPSRTESGSGIASASGVAVCDPFGNVATADTTVNATLGEYTISLDATSAPTGRIHFAIENAGADVHEVVVVRAGSVDELPLDADGALAEDELAEGALIGEVEGFPAGETCDGTFELPAGDYVLLCNLVEEAGVEDVAHLKEGMATRFQATDVVTT